MRRFCALVLALLLAALAGRAEAQDLSGTLKKIRDTGSITLGHRESSVPFSYYDGRQQVVGFAMDLCYRIVDAVKAELKLPDLAVKLNPVTSATRIPLMANGTIDLECGSTTDNAERRNQVGFALTHFVAANRFVAKKSSGIASLDDLKGKAVVSTSGTSNIKQLTEINGKRGLDMRIIPAKDHAEAFLTLETDRASAFVMDDVLLASLVAASKDPSLYAMSKESLSAEPYAIMMRKDDTTFKRLADSALAGLMRSGEFERIYAKWFLAPIPPHGLTLGIPLGPELKAIVADPQAAMRAGQPAAKEQTGAPGAKRGMGYNWNWRIFFEMSPDGHGTYLDLLLDGAKWTVVTALLSWIMAMAVGVAVGIARTSPNTLVSGIATAHVELFRNVPLLVQMFLWFFVLPELLPKGLGTWLKQLPSAPFLTATIALGFFTAARIAEQVRSGIEAYPRGQKAAATALGLDRAQSYRLVILPNAFRMIVPTLTSEFLNNLKNTSVALTIGLIELTARARAMQEFSFQVFEAFTAATLIYVAINLTATFLARRLEAHLALPGQHK
jgi:glutamate/aspartate transport system substrate-binding protein